MTDAEKQKHCAGCRDDFYNGHNDIGVKECWELKSAELVWKKEVPVDQRPPWKQKPIQVLSCFRRPRHVYVDPGREF